MIPRRPHASIFTAARMVVVSLAVLIASCSSAPGSAQSLPAPARHRPAVNKAESAFYFFVRAGEKAGTQKDFSRQMTKAAASVAHMSPQEIIFLCEKTAPPRIQKEVLFKAAVAKANAGNARDALELFRAFATRFPHDRFTPTAKSIIADLSRQPQDLPPAMGILLPLTGYYEAGGKLALSGINYYRQTRAGEDPKFIVMDTASDPDQAARAVQALKAKGAACIIGPMVTASAAAEQARKLAIPMIILSQTPAIPEISPLVFRHFLFPEQQVGSCAAYIMETYHHRRFAVLYPDDKYGTTFAAELENLLPAMGGQVTDALSYPPGQTDFSDQIKQLIKGYKAMDSAGRFRAVSLNRKKGAKQNIPGPDKF